jgi:hypothetical protein
MLLMADTPVDHVFNIVTAAEWHAQISADGQLPFWVIYYNTVRYPHIYHARAWSVPAHGNGSVVQPVAYAAILVAPTLDAIRSLLPEGLVHIERAKNDPWDLVERWMS